MTQVRKSMASAETLEIVALREDLAELNKKVESFIEVIVEKLMEQERLIKAQKKTIKALEERMKKLP